MWFFVSGFFHLAAIFSRFIHIAAYISYICTYISAEYIIFYGRITFHGMDFCSSVYLLIDIWIVSTFWLQ